MTRVPAVGDPAPEFVLPDASGEIHSLADLRGRWVVLYFYPKDETPGCIVEACAFRDRFAEFRALDAVVVGVSPDSAESHRAFAEHRQLPFPLLADVTRVVIQAYDAEGVFGLYTRRKTFVIDPDGIVRGVYESNLHAESHVPHALDSLKQAIAERAKRAQLKK